MSRTSDVLAPAVSRMSIADRIVADYAPYALFSAEAPDVFGGSSINGWRDHSGNGRHLTTLTSTAPTYTAASSYLGNRPALIFSGGYLTTTSTAFDFGDCAFLFVFADASTVTTEESPGGTVYSTGYWLGRNASNANTWTSGFIEPGAPYGQLVTAADGLGHAICSTRSGTTHTVYVNGTSAASKVGSGAALSATAFSVGGGTGGGILSSTHVALVGVWNSALPVASVKAIQLMGRGYWGLP